MRLMWRYRMAVCWLCVACLLFLGGAVQAQAVSGTVLGPDEKPLAGAQVFFFRGDDVEKMTVRETDADGKFNVPPDGANETKKPSAGAGARNAFYVTVFVPGLGLQQVNAKPGDALVIRMKPGAQLHGVVKDAAGQPLAGVVVKLLWLRSADRAGPYGMQSSSLYIAGPLGDKVRATTGKDGSWSIGSVWAAGKACVALDDARFAGTGTVTEMGPDAAPATVVARPAAVITGRVVYKDGKPAAGVKVSTRTFDAGGFSTQSVSAADGSYRMDGLPAGSFTVAVREPTDKWVALSLEGVVAREGRSVAAPDLVLMAGAIVRGTVVDAETRAPVVGAAVGNARAQTYNSSQTDAKGRYSLRVPPGKNQIYIVVLPIGYLQPEQGSPSRTITVTLEEGADKTIDFRLRKGLTLAGVALNTDGKPATGVLIKFKSNSENDRFNSDWQDKTGVVDAEGKWSIGGLKAGNGELSALGAWQIVGPQGGPATGVQKVSVPAVEPLRLTLRAMVLPSLSGRVVTPAGAPVAGAKVQISLSTPLGEGRSTVSREEITTDAQGHFSRPDLRPEVEPSLSVQKPDYKYVSGGQVTKKDGVFEVSDVTLAPLSGWLRGRVVDAAGAAVAGAVIISPDSGPDARTTSDAAGRFELKSLPDGQVTVLAVGAAGAGRSGVGQARALAGTRDAAQTAPPLTITLAAFAPPPERDITRARAILRDVLQKSQNTKYYARSNVALALSPYDPEGTLQLNAEGDAIPQVEEEILAEMLLLDPARAVVWGPDKLAQIVDADRRTHITLGLGLAAVDADAKLAAELFERARLGLKPVKQIVNEITTFNVANYSLLAVLAKKLGRPDAKALLEVALTLAAQLPPVAQIEMLSNVMPMVVPHDAAIALQMLEELAQIETPPQTGNGRSLNQDPEWAFGLAAKPVIAALGKTDPAAALALARRVTSQQHKAMALALAAQSQPRAAAATVFREAVAAAATDGRATALISRIAAMAFESDPQLGAELFAEARARLEVGRYDWDQGEPVAAFAFYYARVDGGESRLLLESEYARQMQAGNATAGSWGPSDLALAMAAVDIERALEMARRLPHENARFDVQRKIAQYVVAPQSVRRSMPFDRWGASDTWTPGTPDRW